MKPVMARTTSIANWILKLPLLWGGLGCLTFYACLKLPYVQSELLDRYFNGHIVEQVATLLFCTAAASLIIRLGSLMGQFSVLDNNLLGKAPVAGQPVSETPELLAKLDRVPALLQKTYLVQRLRDALNYVQECDSADGLEEQLERLEVADQDRMSTGYALPKLVRSTLPIIGMLGTVIGITMAIGQLSPDQLEQSLTSVMGALSIAFDTTAQAMSLMLVLWFAMFTVEQVEQRLLDRVNQITSRMLVGRFQQFGASTDPNVASIRRMTEQVVTAVEQLAAKQADTWQTVIEATHTRWQQATNTATETLSDSLSKALNENLDLHAQGLTQGAEQQIERLADSITEQTKALGTSFERQLSMLSQIEKSQLVRIEKNSTEQTDRLIHGTDSLIKNLGDGLERMAELLVEALHRHGETLTSAEESLASENRRHLSEVEAALGESMVLSADRQEKLVRQSENVLREMQETIVSAANSAVDQQQQLVKQGDILLRVVETTNQVQQLEDTLSRNLSALGRTHNLEETLLSLSAAIQLLSARAGNEANTDKRSLNSKTNKAA